MSETPRVAITLTQLWHQVPGGTATSSQRLVEALAQTGRVELVGVGAAGDLRRPKTLLNPAPPVDWNPPIEFVRMPLPLPLLYDAWTHSDLFKIASRAEQVDLIHLTVPIRPPVEKTPFVATVHDLFALSHPELMTARGAKLMRAGIEQILLRAQLVMVPSQCVADDCVAAGLSPDRVRVVPWGVKQVDLAEDAVEQVRERYRLPERYVLFVGTIEPRKNLGLLVQAMQQLAEPDLALVLVGPGGWGEAFGSAGPESLANLPFTAVQLGFLPEKDLAALECGAEAFCFPSLAEGFGLPVLEAMAAGAAVVTSLGTATAEVAGDGALLIDPHSAEDLAAALDTLLHDHALAAALRARGQKRSKIFTWQRSAELTMSAYTEVLA